MRVLTPTELHALRYLNAAKNPVRCSEMGWELFGKRGHKIGSSNPFTRCAGRVLRRLERMNLAVIVWRSEAQRPGWMVTQRGAEALR